MKNAAKRLLSLLTVLALVLSALPGVAMAEFEPEIIAEGVMGFDTYDDAFNGGVVAFTTETGGDVSVQIPSCTVGYCIEIFEDGEWISAHTGRTVISQTDDEAPESNTVTFAVTAGVEYEVLICSYDPEADDYATGYVSYKITFLSNGETPEPENPDLTPGATPENPKTLPESGWEYIGAGKTVWYLYDNRENMTQNGVYSMMLHVTSSADYAVTYAGENVPVDENGFVNYEMEDTDKQGIYLFSITNNSAEEKFFSFQVKEKPVYVISGESLAVGRTNITLDATVPYTLYEFSPTRTGVYQIKAAQGTISDWGSAYNPINNTTGKTNTLIWTCTAVGQSVMVGFAGPKTTTCTIIRTGDYIPPEEVPWTYYENTYDFSYELPADAETVDIDLTDGGVHTAVLDEDGFYRYGNAEGPLMVTDLSGIEINLADAYVNGGLRAWLQDENHETISKVDYNEAMNQYLLAGLVPVTQELATMLREVGQANGWWIAGGMIFAEGASVDVSIAWMQLCAYLVEEEGITVSGGITTGAEGETTLELYSGETLVAAVTTADGTYALEGIAAGSYTLKVSKLNHVSREYTVTVGEEALALDVKLHLIGDIDGNGKINVGDVSKLNSHVKNVNLLTDEYMILCANVNGGKLNMGDVSSLYAHIKGTKKLY